MWPDHIIYAVKWVSKCGWTFIIHIYFMIHYKFDKLFYSAPFVTVWTREMANFSPCAALWNFRRCNYNQLGNRDHRMLSERKKSFRWSAKRCPSVQMSKYFITLGLMLFSKSDQCLSSNRNFSKSLEDPIFIPDELVFIQST